MPTQTATGGPGTAGGGRSTADQVPRVDRSDAQRRWIAEQLADADVVGSPAPLPSDAMISLAQLEEAGFTPGPVQRTAAEMNNGLLTVGDSRLTPLELTQFLMVRDASWTPGLDTVAAKASERIWQSAYEDFAAAVAESAVSDDAAAEHAARAWESALTLVLPPGPHPASADSRYAGAEFRGAVRKVAEHLLAAGPDADSAVALADEARDELGLPPADRVATTSGGPRPNGPGRPAAVPGQGRHHLRAAGRGRRLRHAARRPRSPRIRCHRTRRPADRHGQGQGNAGQRGPDPGTEHTGGVPAGDADRPRPGGLRRRARRLRRGPWTASSRSARVWSPASEAAPDTDAALAAARVGADRAYGKWESAAERLRELGVDPTAWDESEDLSAVPHLAHDAPPNGAGSPRG
ncbi:hypothetical protein IHE61_27245 [Streptomyces sp. GKU 257-1]|nr:hypothetical protein [Streptomyces sp. GKU 257-1]